MREFYILSLKWTRTKDNLLTWWGPNDSGYVFRLECAGRYSAEQVEANRTYYDSGEHTLAIPCEAVEALSVFVGEAMSRSISPDRVKTDRVVEYHHYTPLKAAHGFRRKRAQTRKRWQAKVAALSQGAAR
jgi:hypothetical protein